ncbi:MBL fold metallo-hydrolase [Bradyrhizobium sp. 195]|uniref:MBL fold metallo-hydrolase n=1 Tax=Bradyrhizobium sp. 195 TaxID=2782662 RepID=UPI00200113CA|nr:MBL fold metallo-hydrolase [Bradyrhizobium sp. 195]UPK29568.1 MBL fold metallo-hydrolase [Bradyrhizobium sp. 195]
MFFSLDVLRARKGDCLMLHFGSEQDPHLILIDGGPSNVYEPFLKPRLQEIHETRDLGEEALPVDVVMVSHVDDDHIKGILDLTREQRTNSPDVRLAVTSLWHNSFDDLLKTKPHELVAGFGTASVETTVAAGEAGIDSGSVLASFGKSMLRDDADIEEEGMHQTVEVLSSIPQGRTLRDDARALGWKPNHKFKGKLILAAETAKPVTLGDLTITVVGPMQPELLALQAEHDKWLRAQKEKKKKSPEAALAAFVDESIPNLSSIVVLAELGGKTMLLTGDARGDKILEGMEQAGLLKAGGKKHVDLLKVPHHGSDNNMETIFFNRVPADHYVFSGDGEHGNPERATLEMLLQARGADADYTIHLTYPVEEIDIARQADWEKEQAKEKARKKKNPASKKPIRENWSPAKHSLGALFKNNPKLAGKVVIVNPDKPHLIDLLEPLDL